MGCFVTLFWSPFALVYQDDSLGSPPRKVLCFQPLSGYPLSTIMNVFSKRRSWSPQHGHTILL